MTTVQAGKKAFWAKLPLFAVPRKALHWRDVLRHIATRHALEDGSVMLGCGPLVGNIVITPNVKCCAAATQQKGDEKQYLSLMLLASLLSDIADLGVGIKQIGDSILVSREWVYKIKMHNGVASVHMRAVDQTEYVCVLNWANLEKAYEFVQNRLDTN